MDVAGTTVVVSASIGVVVSSPESSTEELLADADEAMYAAKQLGLGRLVVGVQVSESDGVGLRHSLQHDHDATLEHDRLRVHRPPNVAADAAHPSLLPTPTAEGSTAA